MGYSPWGRRRVRQDLVTEQQRYTLCTVCEILARQLSYKVFGRKNSALILINHQNFFFFNRDRGEETQFISLSTINLSVKGNN